MDWRTVGILAVPGFLGAFVGATFLASLDGDAAKPWVAGLLLTLGAYVVWRFLRLGGSRPQFKARPSAFFLAPMGVVGGALVTGIVWAVRQERRAREVRQLEEAFAGV